MKATSSTPMSNLIGCIFKHLRNERFADQELVALRLGLSVSTISKIELGNVSITVESIFRMCELFGIDMIDFFKYLNDAKEYLESIDVQVYVDRSLKVKGVDKRVVSYEIEKKYEGIATSGVILPPTAIDLSLILDLSDFDIEKIADKTEKLDNSENGWAMPDRTNDLNEHPEVNENSTFDLPILHIKQLYILLEDFFEKNTMPLSKTIQQGIDEIYSKSCIIMNTT